MTLKIQKISVQKSGPAVLLVHGWAMNSFVWQPLIEVMPDYNFYTLDLPGHGKNKAVPVGKSLGEWNTAALSALENVGLEQCHIVAWSLGGALASKMALSLEQNCHSLTLIGSNPKFVMSDDWPYAMPAVYLDNFMQNLQQDIEKVVRDFMGLQVRGVSNAKTILETIMSLVEKGGFASDEGLKNGLVILQQADLRAYICKLACPINFILGKNDTLVPANVKVDLQKLREDAQIHVVLKSGHAPFVSHVEETKTIICDFIDNCE